MHLEIVLFAALAGCAASIAPTVKNVAAMVKRHLPNVLLIGVLWLLVQDLTVDSGQEVWHARNGDYVLARSGSDGRLRDLTEFDITHWMFWLGHG